MGEIEFSISEFEKRFKKEHPIEHWIDSLFPRSGFFGYAPHYSLTHPHVLFMDLMREIKWAYQRVYRGWDDRAAWSIDWWLNHMLPDVLKRLKKYNHGTPMFYYDGLSHDNDYNYGEENDKIAQARWDAELDKMILGFESAKKMDDYIFSSMEEEEELQKKAKEGMQSFIDHYDNLWD